MHKRRCNFAACDCALKTPPLRALALHARTSSFLARVSSEGLAGPLPLAQNAQWTRVRQRVSGQAADPSRTCMHRKRDNARLRTKKLYVTLWLRPTPSPRRAKRTERRNAHGEIRALRVFGAPAAPGDGVRRSPQLARGRAGETAGRAARRSARGSRRRAARERSGSATDP